MTTVYMVGDAIFKWREDAEKLANATVESVVPVQMNVTNADLNETARNWGINLEGNS